MIDYHIHSKFSDGKNTYQDYISELEKYPLKEIGFSDHLCLYFPNWSAKIENLEVIVDSIKQLNHDKVNIRFGLEVDYLEGKEDEIATVLSGLDLDYVIGSVHYIKDWNFDTNKNDYKSVDIDQFYVDYFETIQKAAKSGLFDIIGHIDLAKKFSYYPSYGLNELYSQTAKVLKESDVVFELNTSGLDKPCNEFYPSDEFLKILYNNNVGITLGSDSHKTEHLCRYFDQAIEKLKIIGYRQLAIFEKRKRSFLSFE